ncbi:MAG TPA: GDSL-type esterase/lipase family protein [Candidatus Atribacteria bacterium]|nr:GDSL-type esterase/lipase family protein [Candidatus Atribacteria bacterium]HPT78635.1 GDSL-type esterase/lipase family protein [Candidatus Atribacteria bacterium]
MIDNPNLKVIALSEAESLKVHGRTTGSLSPLTLFWTGSGLELNVTGSELWIELEVDYDIFEQWITILINSEPVSRLMLVPGRYWLCVFRGMDKAKAKNVRIVKDVQPMGSDPAACLQIHALKSDGSFLPVEDRPVRIEFIGDSITSGEGAIGARQEEDWIPMLFSAVRSYTYMTAAHLNADYRVVSQSGWGVLCGWDNNPNSSIPRYYEQVCGVLTGERNRALGAFEQNDFDSWQPDIVVVNLGTNDAGAFNSPEWKDEATGKVYKQRLNSDGTYNAEDLKAFEDAVEAFLFKLRKCNKNAHIIWAYGMLGIPMMPAICRAVDSYMGKTGDEKVSVFRLPQTREETLGARMHPGAAAHEEAAKALAERIRELLSQKK